MRLNKTEGETFRKRVNFLILKMENENHFLKEVFLDLSKETIFYLSSVVYDHHRHL